MATKKKRPGAKAEKPEAPGAVARKAAELKGAPEEREARAAYLREWRAKKKQAAMHPKPEDDATAGVIEVTADDVEMGKGLGDALWGIAAPMASLKPLNDEQRERLGRALAPIIKKYMPVLGDWQYEAALAMVVFSLARENYVPPKPKVKSGEPIEDAGATGDGLGTGE